MRRLRIALCLTCFALAMPAVATEVQNICRLKGQEPIRLTGLGLVTGLAGTGDSRFVPMHTAVAQAMLALGNRVANLRELENLRNVALVSVSCEISPAGGREGDRVDCFVTSIATARSLEGGRLLSAALTGPYTSNPAGRDPPVFAMASGNLILESDRAPNNGRIDKGAVLIQDLPAPFIKCNDRITLVIDEAHATFPTANMIATQINRRLATQLGDEEGSVQVARALDAKNVEVFLPEFARENVVLFVADILETKLDKNLVHTEARVVINERVGEVTVTGEVELKPVMVAHKNLIIFPPGQAPPPGLGPPPPNPFMATTPTPPPYPNQPELANLADLLAAMNQLQLTAQDKIAVVKELAKTGKLHSKVIFE